MKAVPADSPILAPDARDRIRRSLSGHRHMERGVEDRDVRMFGEQSTRFVDGSECGCVVEWGNLGELLDRRPHRVVDQSGLDEMSSVDDAVTNGTDLLRTNGLEIIGDLHALVLEYDAQLEAG